jgi:hypothetical protein
LQGRIDGRISRVLRSPLKLPQKSSKQAYNRATGFFRGFTNES